MGMTREVGTGCGASPAVLAFLLATLAPGLCSDAQASDGAPNMTYFGTLGLTRSSADQVHYVRDLSQPSGPAGGNVSASTDTVLGIHANYVFQPAVAGAAQVVSRYRYDGSWAPEVMWAFVRLEDGPGTGWRIGRVGTDFYMHADSRLVGYANTSIRPSPDYFGQLPLYHIDGFDWIHTLRAGQGLVTGKFFAGYTGEKVPMGDRYWNMGGSPMLGGNLDYHLDAWSFRLGYAQMRLKHDWPLSDVLAPLYGRGAQAAAAAQALSITGKTSRYYGLGVTYDQNPLQVQLMLNAVQQESHAYQNYRAAYVLASYRLGAFRPYGGISRSYSRPKQLDTGLPKTDPLRAVVDYALNVSHTHQTTYSLGVRWDFRRDMDLKLQWDGIRGRSTAQFLYRGDGPQWSGDSNVLSLALDFAF